MRRGASTRMGEPSSGSPRDLEGNIVVVTGAGRGFGRAIAENLASEGADLCLISRTRDEIEAVAQSIEGKCRVMTFAADITDRASVVRAFQEVDRRLGPVSTLVNNAGTLNAIGPFWKIEPDAWWREVEIHLRGTVLCSHIALERMVPRDSGRIINVGGLLGQNGEPYSTAYTCAKAAIYRFTESLANELKGTDVRAFCMSPGPVQTRMTRGLLESTAGRRWLPEFSEIAEGEWVPAERGAELVHRLARGDGDALAGRAMHVMYDLDDLLARADEISAGDRFTLRIST